MRRLRALWQELTATLWFVPGLIVVAMAALAVAMVELSARVDAEALARYPRIFGASADSSRAMLSAIAGAMITVAGLTFSLMVVAVTQASAQYTPRILRNFMRDRANQLVLGVYVGIFAYSLLVVRTIRSGEEGRFVPSLAVVLGIAFAMASVGVLIFFVHHIASSLQASTIVRRVTWETLASIDRLFPQTIGDEVRADGRGPAMATADEPGWEPLASPATGYVQSVDGQALLRLADAHGLVVRLVPAVGDFVVEDTPIAWVARRPRAPAADEGLAREEDWRRALPRLLTVSAFRTIEQDAAFGVRQLVDVALRALSPGVNDTTTAVTCVDHLGAVLVRLGGRRVESGLRASDGVLRVIAPGPTFESLLALAVDEIRQSARGNVGVLARLFDVLDLVARQVGPGERRRSVLGHAALVREAAEASVPSPHDREQLRERADRVQRCV